MREEQAPEAQEVLEQVWQKVVEISEGVDVNLIGNQESEALKAIYPAATLQQLVDFF